MNPIVCIIKSVNVILLTLTFIGCCFNPSSSNKTIKTQLAAVDSSDHNFYSFIEKFSTDTLFQYSRTQYPLMVIESYEEGEGHFDTFYHADHRALNGKMDFRNKRTPDQFGETVNQKIAIDKNNRSATIDISGIDCGIAVYYHFTKIKGAWMLTQIEDWSN